MAATHGITASVILPLYHSSSTLAASLSALAQQSRRDFEVILVESSGDSEAARLAEVARSSLPGLTLIRSAQRLLPQAARNLGARQARGRLLIFSDPDCYARHDWLERLVAAFECSGQPIVGALACHGGRPFDRAVHLCKFSKWLPAGAMRPVDMGPTANLLCAREVFDRAGGFQDDPLQGDTTFSWRLRRGGASLIFEPAAVVEHHHLDTWRSFLGERFRRGRGFAALRIAWLGGKRRTCLAYLLASALPIRLLSNLFHVARHARRDAAVVDLVCGLPVVVAGLGASLAGESAGYARCLLRRSAREPDVRSHRVGIDESTAAAKPVPAAR